jgi:hypothetical protein
MRARGALGLILAVCAVSVACGGDDDGSPDGKGGDGAEAGDGASSGAGGKGTGGTKVPPGGSEGKAGSAPRAGSSGSGGSDAEGGTSNGDAGMPGNPMAGMGGTPDEDPEDPVPTDPQPITFTVTADQDVHAISPLIYGANMDGLSCADSKARFSFCRHRSPAWSTYNWENNASNAGFSNCNENNAALSAKTTPGAAVTDLIDQAVTAEASTIVTVPMLHVVAADKNDGDAACSGDVSATANYLTTRFKQNRLNKGAALSLTPNVDDAFVNEDEFLNFLLNYVTQQKPTAQLLFALDNQMELWNQEHPKLRTEPLDYAEEVQLSTDYAKMIKGAFPTAEVLGFVGYGWLAALSQQRSPDYLEEGEFWSYYLAAMKAASDTAGKRLIDYVDLHWFSEIHADGERVIYEGTSFQSVLNRVQGTRSFWDPDYIEDSWITADNGGEPIQLIPWLKDAIADNYPGTKLALSEWSFGGGTHISGGVVAADALGLFGQKGVDLAGVVSFSPDQEPYMVGAFQAFRNYDGQGAAFGDTSVAATSSNAHHGTIYASVDSADPSKMVLVAINRRAGDLTTTLTIDHDTQYTKLTPYKIHDGQPEPTLGAVITTETANSFSFSLPGYSVWVLVPGE